MPRPVSRSTILSVLAIGALTATSVLAWRWLETVPPEIAAHPTFVGRQTCAQCHPAEYHAWLGSDHERAMDLATEKSVLGNFQDATFEYQGVASRFFRRDGKFMVHTEGPDGQHHDYEIKYTFGVRPLQQYMVEFPDGRVQVLRESWDVKNKKWFYVTPPDVVNERILPGDPLHWTGIGQNWNSTCADCHSTDVHKNYDSTTNSYKTSWFEINVGCEECHGPGSVHVELARRWSPFWDRKLGYGIEGLKEKAFDTQLETCAKCHARRYQVHEDFRAGNRLFDHYEPVTLEDGLYQSDGQILDEVYEYDSFRQSKMYANHVRCTDCHEPHSLRPKFTGNALCTQCHEAHNPAKYDTPAHHHHKPGTPAAECVACHMPTRTYMVIDERRDHSFRLPRPDVSAALGTSNACNNCHAKPAETFQWAADAIVKWYGPRKPNEPPHWAAAIAAGRAGKPEGETLLLDLLQRGTTPAVVRATAIELLANFPSSPSAVARRNALRESDPQIRLAAIRALPGDDPRVLATELAGLLDDPLRTVRVAAAARLAYLPIDHLSDAQHRAFEQAMREFRAGQELSLDHAGSHLTLASLDRRYRRVESAVRHLSYAIMLEPYLAGARGELASLLEEQGGDPVEVRRLRSEEAGLLERDTKIAPNRPDLFYRLGLLRYLLDEYDRASAALERACALAPLDYEFRRTLGLLQLKFYELSGDKSHSDAVANSINTLNEIRRDDPQTQQLARELQAVRAKRKSVGTPSDK